MSGEHVPTRRRVVGGFALLGIGALVLLISLANALRLPTPPLIEVDEPADAGQAVDPLREDVECPIPEAREGLDRPEVPTGPALPAELTSGDLLDCPSTWDGRIVRLRGEVVGAPLHRRTDTWLQLNDDAYALDVGPLPNHQDFQGGNSGIGVLVTPGQAAVLEFTGRTGIRGDIVEVTGVFHRVHSPSGEVAIVQADDLVIERRGFPYETPSASARPLVAAVAALIALATVMAERRLRSRI